MARFAISITISAHDFFPPALRLVWRRFSRITCDAKQNLLAFLDDVYEDLELWYPKLRLEEAGYALKCAAPEIKTYTGKHGYPAAADLLLKDARSQDFCGLLVPGGFMPDKLRRDAKVLSLTREFFEEGKLVAFICHGGWIPISAKILKANASPARSASRTTWKMPAASG